MMILIIDVINIIGIDVKRMIYKSCVINCVNLELFMKSFVLIVLVLDFNCLLVKILVV